MEIEKKIEDFIKAMNFPILNKQIITEKSIKKIEKSKKVSFFLFLILKYFDLQ